MPKVTARRRTGYTHDVEIDSGHTLVIDEAEDAGGGNEGPTPTRTVASALAACTAITVEMYAGRKEWDLGNVEVEVEMGYEGYVPNDFTVVLRVEAELSDEQREKLLVIAGKCPVHRLLAGNPGVSVSDRIEPLVP
jgi:putative redox protein